MTPEKVLEVIETYRQLFVERNIGKIDYPHDSPTPRTTTDRQKEWRTNE